MDLWRIPRQRGRRVITNLVILSPILRRIMMMIMRCMFRQMWIGNFSWCPDVAAMQEG